MRRIKPIPRAAAQFELSRMVRAAGAKTAADAVDHLALRLLSVPVNAAVRNTLAAFLERQLGTPPTWHWRRPTWSVRCGSPRT